MDKVGLIEECKKYVEALFKATDKEMLSYHNWKHTMNVFNAVNLIAGNTEGVTEQNLEYLQLAAIFHDVGYLESAEEHEIRSAAIAEKHLQSLGYEASSLAEVKRLILATKLGNRPKDILEEIMVDADLSHLGREDYIDTTYRFLLKEMSEQMNKKMTEKDWAKSCVSFIKAHRFLTEFARKAYRKTKLENLERVKELSEEVSEKENSETKKSNKGKKGKQKKEEQLKGVETMFRVSLRNHVNLSKIADNKANTLISVNAIIISIVLSALFPKLDSNPFLFYPSVTILIGSFATIILSILSTIPNVTRGLIGRDEVEEKKGNLLFFGNFHKMTLEDYEWSVNKLMISKDYIYGSLTRDLFFLGKVLNKKYMLLRWAYFIFMFGLFLSIIVFVINVMPYIDSTSDIGLEEIGGIL